LKSFQRRKTDNCKILLAYNLQDFLDVPGNKSNQNSGTLETPKNKQFTSYSVFYTPDYQDFTFHIHDKRQHRKLYTPLHLDVQTQQTLLGPGGGGTVIAKQAT
jgi:hypothetical protein